MPQTKESASSTDIVTSFVLPPPAETLTITPEQLKTTLRKLSRDSPAEGEWS